MAQNIIISKPTLIYSVLDKDKIKTEIVPHLPLPKRGFHTTVPLEEVVNAVLYKLKTGVQRHQLPVKALFETDLLSWQAVYYHYRKWCKNDILKQLRSNLKAPFMALLVIPDLKLSYKGLFGGSSFSFVDLEVE